MKRQKALMLGVAGVGAGIALKSMLVHGADLRGHVVLITGGSRGLGLALAREFARQGCRIVICARKEHELEVAAESLRSAGADVHAVVCDVSKEQSVDAMIQNVRSHYGQIDVLVNNAGIIRVAPVDNLTTRDFEDAMATMFWGVLYPTLRVIEEMKQRRSGRIVTITSIGGKVSVPHLVPYCCAKFAAVGLCEGLRAELARYGVKVITIAPGLMRTGSYRVAEFKGYRRAEAAWFSVGGSLPFVSMDAERAARQIVSAVRRGRAERILSTQASLLARVHGVLPGLVADSMAIVNRMLPGGTSDRESVLTGAQAEAVSGPVFRVLTTLGRRAAERLNEPQAAL